jgi:hypothetical protein
MTVIHVDAIAVEDKSELVNETQAHSFNTEDSQDLLNVI